MPDPFDVSTDAVLWIVLDAFAMLAATIFVVRLSGLRSFAKMSSFDFAVTVACGSILASVVLSEGTGFLEGTLALAGLLLAQVVVALGRVHLPSFAGAIDNTPLMLMKDGSVLDANLRAGRVTRDDLYAKLREANVLRFEDVRAVVLETTGDISVLHGDGPVAPELIAGVRASP